ncbi:DNA methyltransferase [Bdellovibrio sp. KM01]|uniref:class I SAM-dependent DNA methyltransferase n=1 Tax=Bdellovibrio sp. KM01 TaxID=2748865 RepID=UPI0015EA00ED|nr:DNA methyltransferase [Bdellovibrio sp. KM01]QLY25275.1 class I SAM-dependent DNA methyltransferase [Bdellovibrio sp. KM01]
MKSSYATIQMNLSKFYSKWQNFSGNERQGSQIFLADFFSCFGLTFDDPNAIPFEVNTGKGFADAFLKDSVVFEMKSKKLVKDKSSLEKQLPQALKYWDGKGRHAPFIVLCNFVDFIIFDTRDRSKHYIKIGELESKAESFNFLMKLNPAFAPEQEAVTRQAAKIMGKLYQDLKNRLKGRKEEVDIFVLQCLFCLFSEDIGYLPVEMFSNSVRRIRDGEDNSANILSTLFKMMDERDSDRKRGKFEHVRYFNGPLFRIKPEIVLTDTEVECLWEACQYDWKTVRPEIFGALFESSQSKKSRHADGMHFTSEIDIKKVIYPCVVEPWNEILENCKSPKDLQEAHQKLKSYRVLDPACGSGNFLIVAYRELKKIEEGIFIKYKAATGMTYNEVQAELGWFPLTNLYGIEVNAFPSLLTRVSLWITKKMVKSDLKLTEPDLPLEELKHIICADALEVKWDDVDVVVGNPPYLGCKQIRKARGDRYFKWLGERFPDHSKMSDYCTYWFEKVLEDVKPGVRIGLVCTKSISQTNSRLASLEKIVSSGGTIFNAISNKKWSGEAKVHVSIVNFVHKSGFVGKKYLDNKEVMEISSRLKNFAIQSESRKLKANGGTAYVGPVPNGKGFIIDSHTRSELLKESPKNRAVIKEFLTGEDLVHNADQSASRWIIDFQDWPLEKAMEFKGPMKIITEKVKPVRKKIRGSTNDAKNYRMNWWRFGRPQMGLRQQISHLKKFVTVSRVGKYPIFVFVNNKNILPADSTVAIAFDSFGQMGVLQSKFHTQWFNYQCSSLKGDARYTNTTVFETFPFPEKISSEVGTIMKKIEAYRSKFCKKMDIGLTTLYNQMNDGAHIPLKQLHKQLDQAVAECYGYPKAKIESYNDIINFLTDLNLLRASQEDEIALREKAAELAKKASRKATKKRAA